MLDVLPIIEGLDDHQKHAKESADAYLVKLTAMRDSLEVNLVPDLEPKVFEAYLRILAKPLPRSKVIKLCLYGQYCFQLSLE